MSNLIEYLLLYRTISWDPVEIVRGSSFISTLTQYIYRKVLGILYRTLELRGISNVFDQCRSDVTDRWRWSEPWLKHCLLVQLIVRTSLLTKINQGQRSLVTCMFQKRNQIFVNYSHNCWDEVQLSRLPTSRVLFTEIWPQKWNNRCFLRFILYLYLLIL